MKQICSSAIPIMPPEGALWEQEVFGQAACDRDQPPYRQFDSALSEVLTVNWQKTVQHWDPDKPSTEIGYQLFQAVESFLPVLPQRVLRLYSAIGSALDYYHGIDGVFYWRGQKAYIDLTVNDDKISKSSHIFIFHRFDLVNIHILASKIAKRLTGA